MFFARKFDPTIDESIIDWLSEKIIRKNLSTSKFVDFEKKNVNGRLLSDNFYLENLYDSSDKTINLSQVFTSFHFYVHRKLFSCHSIADIHLEQIHSIYNLSLFQGYSFQYEIENERIELFIQLNSFESKRSEYVQRFEVKIPKQDRSISFFFVFRLDWN